MTGTTLEWNRLKQQNHEFYELMAKRRLFICIISFMALASWYWFYALVPWPIALPGLTLACRSAHGCFATGRMFYIEHLFRVTFRYV